MINFYLSYGENRRGLIIYNKKDMEKTMEDKKENNYEIKTRNIFKDIKEANYFLTDVRNEIDKNIEKYNVEFKNIKNMKDLAGFNKKYKIFYDEIYKKLEKVEVYIILRRDLNIKDRKIYDENLKIKEEILNSKKTLFNFAKKLINKKENIEKIQIQDEKKKLKSDKVKEKQRKKEKLIHKYSINIKDIKENSKNNIEKLKENAKIYIDIYKIIKEEGDIFLDIFNHDVNKEKIFKIINEKIKKENVDRKNKIINKLRQIKKESTKLTKNEMVENANKYLLISLEKLGKEYNLKLKNIFGSNRIDYFKRKNKVYINKTIPLYKGYIVLQNDEKYIDLSHLAHEIGHLVRYEFVSKKTSKVYIEEIFASLNEFLVLDYISKKETPENNINFKELSLGILSKIFDTTECFLFQDFLINLLNKENISNEKVLKKIIIYNKKRFKNSKLNNKNVFKFASSPSYLKPYYSLIYFIAVNIAFNLFKKIIQNDNNDNSKIVSLIKKEDLKLKDLLSFLNVKSIYELICIEEILTFIEEKNNW